MRGMLRAVEAIAAERSAPRAGDAIVEPADVVMDRAFTVARPPEQVWPWLVQLGKRRAVRSLDERWLTLKVGDVIPDYGGAHATFQVAEILPPTALVYRSRRGKTELSWSITLAPDKPTDGTRIFLRLRMAPVRHRRVARTVGEFFDALTVAGMAAGLRERLADPD